MKRHLVLAFLVAFAASGALAQQKMFKSTMPDGKVIYSEKPEPNAKRVEAVNLPPPTAGVSVVTPQEQARADQLKRDQAAAGQRKGNDLEDARKQLKAAEAARDSAKEPQPGERLGTAKGGSRLTDDYFKRQKTADEAVAAARKRVDELERR